MRALILTDGELRAFGGARDLQSGLECGLRPALQSGNHTSLGCLSLTFTFSDPGCTTPVALDLPEERFVGATSGGVFRGYERTSTRYAGPRFASSDNQCVSTQAEGPFVELVEADLAIPTEVIHDGIYRSLDTPDGFMLVKGVDLQTGVILKEGEGRLQTMIERIGHVDTIAGIFDTQFGVECFAAPDTTGQLRCAPDNTGGLSTTYFTTPDCTAPGVLTAVTAGVYMLPQFTATGFTARAMHCDQLRSGTWSKSGPAAACEVFDADLFLCSEGPADAFAALSVEVD